ncbi:hypothetical protein ACSBR1_009528 [Camellia fascicularis]
MGKLSLGRVLDCLCLSSNSNSCFCINSLENQDEFESKPLVASEGGNLVKLKDYVWLLTNFVSTEMVVKVTFHTLSFLKLIEIVLSRFSLVRMLGSGRPFLVEIQNTRHVPSEMSLKEIEGKINSLENKLKQYVALVWISHSLEDDDLKTLSAFKDMVELLLSFCVEMGFSSVIPVGHDDGGLLALKAA